MAGLILGITSATLGLASTGMGISNASKASRAAQKADRESKMLMKEAERKAEKNFYEGLNVPLDAFNAQFEEQLQQQKQGLQALQEGDARAVASGVGRVGALAGQQGEQTRIAMGEALYANDKMKADSKERVNQNLIDINVGGAADASARARDQRKLEQAGMQTAVGGLQSVVGAGKDIIKTYGMNKADRISNRLYNSIGESDMKNLTDSGLDETDIRTKLGNIPGIENMTKAEINVIIEQMKQGTFDFNFDARLVNPVLSPGAVGSQGVAPTASAGISAPIFTG
mgnify:FL=1|tara:strand:- start:418 stop:1272 length:855 start_codon:yes stop_codon:yes gene_type:complete